MMTPPFMTPPADYPCHLALTMGDPLGIGPEITVKTLAGLTSWLGDGHLTVIGQLKTLEETAKELRLPLPPSSNTLSYFSIEGNPQTEAGKISFEALNSAVNGIFEGQYHGLVTGPISKTHLWQNGYPYSGHTELLQHLATTHTGTVYQPEMVFLYRHFRMLLLTRHVALHDVREALTLPNVSRALHTLVQFLQGPCAIAKPKLCVLGVNPHSFEIDGTEEREILMPAIEAINQEYGLEISPPQPADSVFRSFVASHIPYDAYVAPYHDQGLIPFKMVAGMQAVNVTLGLPFLRTSVSHGTAPDIVGQGIADPTSLFSAVQMAHTLLRPDKPDHPLEPQNLQGNPPTLHLERFDPIRR